MPNKDGTGPQGKGPKTGRQEGACQDAQPLPRGQGIGRGRGCNKQQRLGRCRE